MTNPRFERLLALRGDPVKGLAPTAWTANLAEYPFDELVRAVMEVTRRLVLPEWALQRPDDLRPQHALDAAAAWLGAKSKETVAAMKARAQECTAARNETFGKIHRVPEAARAIVWAASANDVSHLWDALVAVEAELLGRIALVAEYKRGPEQRRAIVDILRTQLEPAETVVQAPTNEPVAYAASGNFGVGQKLTHAKFGNLEVVAAGDKWIDVRLEDGTTKRLAQKPK